MAGRSRTLAAWVADTGPLVWSQGLLWSFHRCGTRSPGHTHSLSHPAHPHTPRRCWASHVTPWGPRPGLDPGSEILSEGLDDPHATGDGPWRPALLPSPPAPSARGQPLWAHPEQPSSPLTPRASSTMSDIWIEVLGSSGLQVEDGLPSPAPATSPLGGEVFEPILSLPQNSSSLCPIPKPFPVFGICWSSSSLWVPQLA